MTTDMADTYDNSTPEPVNLTKFEGRHPSTRHMLRMLAPNINLKDEYYDIAASHFHLAIDLVDALPDTPELTAGLRKLLEAKDCFVRALVYTNPVNYTDR